jgi:hypothetical protein
MRAPFIEPAGANGFRFAWTCSAFNCTYYEFTAPDGSRGKLALRHQLGDYEAGIYNGGAEAYARECGPLVGVLRFEMCVDQPVAPELLDAFNAWHAAKHAAFVAHLRAYPERYGDPTIDPPTVAHDAAYYTRADGWRFNSKQEA